MTCLPRYTPATFGWTPHPERVGCPLRHPFGAPVTETTKKPPSFDKKCPRKESK